MISLRLCVGFLIAGLIAVGCSVQPSRTDITVDAAAIAAATAAYDQARYCDVLGTALLMTPQGIASSTEIAAFADALDHAAEFAKLGHRPTLRAMADINRNTEELNAGRAYSMMNRSISIHRFASEECGISVPGVTVNEDGSVSFSTSFSVSSSLSLDGSVSGGGAGAEFEEPTYIIPTGAGSAPRLDFGGSTTERLAALNASVVGSPDLVFKTMVVATGEDGGYDVLAAIPTGWPVEPEGLLGIEASGDGMSSGLAMEFKSSCQGICAPQSWSAVMQDPDRSPFRTPDSNEVGLLLWQELAEPLGQIMVREFAEESFGRKVEIVLVRWDDNADHYFECSVRLPGDVAHLWVEFAHACALAEPAWIS